MERWSARIKMLKPVLDKIQTRMTRSKVMMSVLIATFSVLFLVFIRSRWLELAYI